MNRRDALKKLAAGGALAAGGSMVLSSREVAYAASPPSTNLQNVPGDGEPLPISVSLNPGGFLQIVDNSAATCTSGSLTRTYAWRINDYDVNAFALSTTRFQVRNLANSGTIVDAPTNGTTCSACPTSYSTPTAGNNGVLLRRFGLFLGFIPFDEPLATGDTYDIGLVTTWQCSGASAAVTAEYRIFGAHPDLAPTVENLNYSVA